LATHNSEVSNVKEPPRCNSFFKYRCELEELTRELLTTKKIIQLLQEDLNTYKDPTSVRTSDNRSNSCEYHAYEQLGNSY
jgi:predicted nucleic acid binding AN1-type Zn finger protein